MGMFDYVRCERPLPDGFAAKYDFQTKRFDCTLSTYTITESGHLIGPYGRMMFHGALNFYTYNADHVWHEYVAKFTDGELADIYVVDGHDGGGDAP